MKAVANRYRIDFHIDRDDPPPIPGLRIEARPFGIPPFEMRQIWTFDLTRLEELLNILRDNSVELTVSLSPYWSGSSIEVPGTQLLGVALVDDLNHRIDSRDAPIPIAKEP